MTALGHTANPAEDDLVGLLRKALEQVAVAGAAEPPITGPTDDHAAKLIQEFLDLKGWSSYDLAAETELIAKEHKKPRMTCSRKTADRILNHGKVPQSRIRAAIALVMGVPPWKIWGEGQMPLAHQREQILAEGHR